jgi:hypothetical protein
MEHVKELNRIRSKRYYDNNKEKILFKRKNKVQTKVETNTNSKVEKVQANNIIEKVETNNIIETNKKLIHYKNIYLRMLNNMTPQQKLAFISTKNPNESDEMFLLKQSLI